MQRLPEPLRRFAPFIGLALLLVIGYLAYGKVSGGGAHEPAAEAEAAEAAPSALDLETAAEEKQDRRDDEVPGPVVTLGAPFVVNLGDPGLNTTLRVAVAVQVDEGTPVVAGEEGQPPHLAEEVLARNLVLDALGSLTSANVLQPAARDEVRALLLRRLNRGLPATLALEAYFTELTVEDASPAARPVDLEAKAEEPADDGDSESSEESETSHGSDESEESEEPAKDAEHADDAEHAEASDAAVEAEAQAKAQVEEEKARAEASAGDDAHATTAKGGSAEAKHETAEEHG